MIRVNGRKVLTALISHTLGTFLRFHMHYTHNKHAHNTHIHTHTMHTHAYAHTICYTHPLARARTHTHTHTHTPHTRAMEYDRTTTRFDVVLSYSDVLR
jgi:hypothetical protein